VRVAINACRWSKNNKGLTKIREHDPIQLIIFEIFLSAQKYLSIITNCIFFGS
jgi:hypothetical protein